MSFPIVMGTLMETKLERMRRATAQAMGFRSGLARARSFTMEESASAGGRREAGSLARVRARKPVLGEGGGGGGGGVDEREVEVDGSEEGEDVSSEVGGDDEGDDMGSVR